MLNNYENEVEPNHPIEIINHQGPIANVTRQEHHNSGPIRQCGDSRYEGVLLITDVLFQAGMGTVLFQSILGSILYASKYNLYPWIHVNSSNKVVWDNKIHGEGGPSKHFRRLMGDITSLKGTGDMACDSKLGIRPGPPNFTSLELRSFSLIGNGFWTSYFEPIPPLDEHCQNTLPIFQMKSAQITAGMHRCSEVAVRAWPYNGIPKALAPSSSTGIHEWLGKMRRRAAPVVKQYYKPLKFIRTLAHRSNPVTNGNCMAMHVRLTDKGHGRIKTGLEAYLPYALEYAQAVSSFNQTPAIYIATDDATIMNKVNHTLKNTNTEIMLQSEALRSHQENTPTFSLFQNETHRSNTEVLIDVYAMAKCRYFVHGYSGMAEGVVYVAPELHEKSVNVDDPDAPMTFEGFRGIILNDLHIEAERKKTFT